jgi:hypothetical protein
MGTREIEDGTRRGTRRREGTWVPGRYIFNTIYTNGE